jgi:hypothetical protein
VIRTADPLLRVLTGFEVTRIEKQPAGLDFYIGREGKEGIVPLQPRESFSGLLPFLALVAATQGLVQRRRLRAVALGTATFFVFHIGLVFVATFLSGGPQTFMPADWVRPVNRVIDVIYAFYGLVGYVALPFLLWFWLARSAPEGQRREPA